MNGVVIIGCGGHGSDTLELIEGSWREWSATVLDDHPDDRRFIGRAKVDGPVTREKVTGPFTLGVGMPWTRAALAARLDGCEVARPVVHASAMVAGSAEMDEGVAVFWLAGVSPLVRIGRHSFVSYGATVGHDTLIGECVAVMPGARVSGDVTVGDGVLIGSGAVILEGRRVGDSARIGAGAVVTSDVPAGATVKGVPAR